MAHEHKLTPPKDFEVPGALKTACIAMVVIGVASFGIGVSSEDLAHSAWNGYLIGFWFTLSLALSGPFIAATQFLTKAGWSSIVRRIPMAYGSFILPATILAIVGVAGGGHLYEWFDTELVHNDHILHKKAGFLNQQMFAIFTFGSFIVWFVVYKLMQRETLAQDEDGDFAHTNRLKALSAIWMIVFVVGFSFMTWHWIMGLQPHWFSTMFNVYTFAGLFQSGLALTVLICLWLRDKGYFGDFYHDDQTHALGQLLFGFTVFYAYIAFSQFLLIWYANIPEEAIWYVTRGTPPDITTGWDMLTLVLPFGKFILPFLILLPQAIKKNKYNILRYVAAWLILMQIYEVWYWVAPTPGHGTEGYAAAPHFPFIEIGVVIGFLGLFGFTVSRALASAPLVPLKDPYLHEGVPHPHHGTKPPRPSNMKIS